MGDLENLHYVLVHTEHRDGLSVRGTSLAEAQEHAQAGAGDIFKGIAVQDHRLGRKGLELLYDRFGLLGGKSVEEAYTLIENTYADRLTSNDVIIYSSKEAKDEGVSDDAPLGHTEELSVEQARETVKY